MTDEIAFNRVARAIVYWPPTGFVGANQQYFEQFGNGIVIEGLRMQFTIEKKLVKDPNSCTLVITNANADTRAKLAKKPLTVKLEAGHNFIARPLFLGNLKNGYPVRERTDWNSKLILGDGSRAYAYAQVASQGFKKGTPLMVVLKTVAKAMGLTMPINAEASSELTAAIAAGDSIHGNARDELTRLLAPYGYNWSIQDGKLQILRANETREDRAWVLDENVPIVGTPQYGPADKESGKPTLSMKTLLFPELVPGGKVMVKSRSITGLHRIQELRHRGDTRGGEWYTEIKAKPI